MLFRLATTMVGTNEDERFTEETAGFANEEVPSWSFGTIATCIETDLCVLPGRFQRFAVTIGVTIAALLLHRSTLHCYSAPWQTATP